MKTASPIAPFAIAALLLSSCGKQEAVSDVPSSEELAKEADAASKAIQDEAAGDGGEKAGAEPASDVMTSYANALRGYSIMIPQGWSVDEEASDDNGRTYKNEELEASLTIGWSENREDADLQKAVKAVEDADDKMSGEYVKDNDYRASGSMAEGQKTMMRLLRKTDGTMVNATISYPSDQSEKADIIATQILDSLALQ